jgi:hypothetical protein
MKQNCYNCEKNIDDRYSLSAWFGWQQDDDAECRNCIDLAEIRKNNKCEHCLHNPDPFCEHSEKEDESSDEDDEELGFYQLPWDDTKNFCSYECLEKAAKGKISWYENDACFSVTTYQSFETRFFCNAICNKCFVEDEQEWIIVYIYDPMGQNLNYRESMRNNKRMRHCYLEFIQISIFLNL